MIHNIVRKNKYYDSVTLMLISKQLKAIDGLDAVSVMMGTPANRVILEEAALLGSEGRSAGPNDLILAFRAPETTDVDEVCRLVDERLSQKSKNSSVVSEKTIKSSLQAYAENPDATLAFISVPGEYAALETYRALNNGKNVLLFSDNVSLEEEVFLKRFADEKNLLVMGPDCGTSIINGVGIGFANRVKNGNVGIVAASGTGLQEATCLLDAMGLGISQAIGTGGRDLKEAVGAVTMLRALEYLLNDSKTEVVMLISKPPAPSVVAKIIDRLNGASKKVILCFIGYKGEQLPPGIIVADTLEDAVLQTAGLLGVHADILTPEPIIDSWVEQSCKRLSKKQQVVRALYTGGTLCYEAMLIMNRSLGPVHSNIPLNKDWKTLDVVVAGQHTAIDLGDDDFTKGKPHPMIDGSLRDEYIAQAAKDPETAVLLLDLVIGFGATDDPASELVPVIEKAITSARAAGNELAVVAYVCGTDLDEQGKETQVQKLRSCGAFVARSNAEAARIASRIAKEATDNHGK